MPCPFPTRRQLKSNKGAPVENSKCPPRIPFLSDDQPDEFFQPTPATPATPKDPRTRRRGVAAPKRSLPTEASRGAFTHPPGRVALG